MSTIIPTTVGSVPALYRVWADVGEGDTLDAAEIGVDGYIPTMIGLHATGTWDSATVKLQGSLDGTAWFDLIEVGAGAASLTADGFLHVPAMPVLHLRPVVSGGGASQDLTIRLAVFRA